MDAWEDITGENFSGREYQVIWKRVEERFSFSSRISFRPPIADPPPSITYFIGHVYSSSHDYIKLVTNLNRCMLTVFRRCVPTDGWLYALDWNHPGYRFRPHIAFNADDENAWRVPVLPNGDYYLFLAEDLRFGVIGHPWEETIFVYGSELLTALQGDVPLLFDTVLRKDGGQVRPLIHGRFSIGGGRQQLMSVVGPPGMQVSKFLEQMTESGYTSPTGHAHLDEVYFVEEITVS